MSEIRKCSLSYTALSVKLGKESWLSALILKARESQYDIDASRISDPGQDLY